MAVPTVAASAASSFSASANVSFTLDAAPAADDVIYVFAAAQPAVQPQDVTGWTNVLGSGGFFAPGDTSMTVVMSYHVVTSGEAGTTAWTLSGHYSVGETGSVTAICLRGVNTATPIDGFGTNADTGAAATFILSATTTNAAGGTAATPTVTDGLVVRYVVGDGAETYTSPGGHTQVATQASNMGLWIGTRDAAATAATDVTATNITPSAADEFVSITFTAPPAAGGGPIDLVVADSTVSATIDTVTLTQAHNLAVADLTVAVAADAPTLTQVHNLAVADLTVATAADTVTLTQTHVLTVEDLTVTVAADTVTLTQVHELVVADAVVAVTIDTVTLDVGATNLEVADLAVVSTIDSVTLTQTHVLTVADLTVTTTIDTVALTQTHTLVVADAVVATTIDTVTLIVGVVEVPDDRTVTVAADTRTVTVAADSRTTLAGD